MVKNVWISGSTLIETKYVFFNFNQWRGVWTAVDVMAQHYLTDREAIK